MAAPSDSGQTLKGCNLSPTEHGERRAQGGTLTCSPTSGQKKPLSPVVTEWRILQMTNIWPPALSSTPASENRPQSPMADLPSQHQGGSPAG